MDDIETRLSKLEANNADLTDRVVKLEADVEASRSVIETLNAQINKPTSDKSVGVYVETRVRPIMEKFFYGELRSMESADASAPAGTHAGAGGKVLKAAPSGKKKT